MTKTTVKKETRSVRLMTNISPSLRKKVQALAAKKKWTMSNLIEEAIIAYCG